MRGVRVMFNILGMGDFNAGHCMGVNGECC